MLVLATFCCLAAIVHSKGVPIGDDVIGYFGVPYAEKPLRENRFKPSVAIDFKVDGDYLNERKVTCLEAEDCLYLDFYQHKEAKESTNTLLLLTNELVDKESGAATASKELNFAVASARVGALGCLNGEGYGVSDVLNIVKTLKQMKDHMPIGKITVWAENELAEVLNEAILQEDVMIDRVILINGNQLTRTMERDNYESLANFIFRKSLMCDLPSNDQALDCMRSKSIEEIRNAEKEVLEYFKPLGSPFRVRINRKIPEKQIPTMMGVQKEMPRGYYLTDLDFTENYSWKDFKRFLFRLIPDKLHKNGGLLRRTLLHHYVHSQGDKKDIYFLFMRENVMLHDRDFSLPTYTLAQSLSSNKDNNVFLFKYGIEENPPMHCLNAHEDWKPYCDRLIGYVTLFAKQGKPTPGGCDPKNPTWLPLKKGKRDFFITILEDGKLDFDFRYQLPEYALWMNYLPYLDKLELVGTRAVEFEEEELTNPIDVEDDVQEWHEKASNDKFEL